MAKLFKIIEIEKESDSIAVIIEGGKVIMISSADFKSFLITHNRLNYCNDTVSNGEHIQFAGTLSFEEYFDDLPNIKHIEQDVYDYIIVHKINWTEKFNGLFECIAGICKDYNQKLLTVK